MSNVELRRVPAWRGYFTIASNSRYLVAASRKPLQGLGSSIHYLSGPGLGADIRVFVIFLRQASFEFFCRVDLHKVNRRPTKSTTSQSSAIASGQFLSDFHEIVQLRGAVFDVIAGTRMALEE